MFRHHGNSRTHSHNLKIATLLSFVAGFVNVVGFVSVKRLTTNVTGHFAFWVEDIFSLKFYDSSIYFLFIFAFFLGAFTSNTLIEIISQKNDKNIFIAPVVLEGIILSVVGVFGQYYIIKNANIIAIALLFSMGLQNALVTKISNAIVRTTHLTGLFTDLGIEVSQLFFYKTQEQQQRLKTNIQLRSRIILFFFIGGVSSGIIYSAIELRSLLVPAFILIGGLIYDSFKFRLLKWKVKNYNN